VTGVEELTSRVGPRRIDVVETEVDGDISLFNPHTQRAFVLNSTASDVWRLCDGEHTVDEIVEILAGAYATSPGAIAAEVEGTVRMFRHNGLLGGGGST
jgi:hypothetical protein